MRLIDADALQERFEIVKKESERLVDVAQIIGVQAVIDSQPTAYDVDKVVERLEENKNDAVKAIGENGKSEYSLIKIKDLKELFEEYTKEQIEIVKSGGIE